MSILSGIFQVFFWSAVLAYVPSALYLVLNPIRSIRAEKASAQGIFILQAEDRIIVEKKRRLIGIAVIYAICLGLVLFGMTVGLMRGEGLGVGPFAILSSLSIMVFCFATLTYLPFAYFIVMKNPQRFQAEGLYLRRVFIFYGAGLLAYGVFFSVNWLETQGIIVFIDEFAGSFLIIFFASAVLSYLPVMIYSFFMMKHPFRGRVVSLRIIFAIYTICFLLFSGLYIHGWIKERRVQKDASKGIAAVAEKTSPVE